MIKRILKFMIKLIMVLVLFIASIGMIAYGASKDYQLRQDRIMNFRIDNSDF